MTPLEEKALDFATRAHKEQVRKYTEEPYINHPAAVAEILRKSGARPEVIAAGYLHDVVEDCDVSLEEIEAEFGPDVAKLVDEVTDKSRPEDGNRATRKAIDRDSLAKASPEGQTIKLADLIDNTSSIVERDPNFAKVYLAEKRDLLEVLTKGDRRLWQRASLQV